MPRSDNHKDRPLKPFSMQSEMPQYNHSPRRAQPHIVTEIAQEFNRSKTEMDEHLHGLTFRLHPRIIKPQMTLPYSPQP